MTGVLQSQLEALYRNSDDPWRFRSSSYEQAKFRATVDALARPRYRSALEVGCGNGELSRHIAPLCDHYTGVDAVDTALDSARKAVPGGHFVQSYLPCELPDGRHDLIVLSEVLYFLDEPALRSLAVQIARRWPDAEVLSVIWLGPSGNSLEGDEALALFTAGMLPSFGAKAVVHTEQYRIDRFTPS